jgi:hypothetical protein
MKLIRLVQAGVVMVLGGATGFGVCAGCNAVSERDGTRAAVVTPASEQTPRNVAVPAPVVVSASAIVTAPTVAVVAKPAPKASSKVNAERAASALRVKRFVVATAVQDREPQVTSDALASDGSAIYAFAELMNDGGESENVRITFERKGGREKVGDVSLPVPANVSRHRTWAFTRYIRDAGVWEAVLWSENGTELSRTSFEVS